MKVAWQRASASRKASLIAFIGTIVLYGFMRTIISFMSTGHLMGRLHGMQVLIGYAASILIYWVIKNSVYKWYMRATVHKNADSSSDPPSSGTPGAA